MLTARHDAHSQAVLNELAARNLLYLQSELAELHEQQQRFDEADVIADLEDMKQCARNFKDFNKAVANGGDPRQKERKELMLEIRSTLKEYREALMFESTLASMLLLSDMVLRTFRDQFHNKNDGKNAPYATLGGNSEHLYDDKDDIVALRLEDSPDRLTKFVQEHLAFMFPRSRPGMAYASDRAIATFISWFSTFLAALLLIGAIIVLYKVWSSDWRLGLIATFTCLFAGSVGLLTNARRAELFAATAA
ncbi:hypothetical protein DE146DRAFT_750072 [Phaeosphaeria sp. MPI-PUGE-AT-0046c]|nr:hypothetical protein DE146DRAFT_750072 [Phaeosphaeria sp. MPI-PUGE-AT-0046c]